MSESRECGLTASHLSESCFIPLSLSLSLCSVTLPLSLSLAGRASESWRRQTGSLTGAVMLSSLAAQARLCFSSDRLSLSSVFFSLRSLARFPVAHGISETWNNERCKSRPGKISSFHKFSGGSRGIKRKIYKRIFFFKECSWMHAYLTGSALVVSYIRATVGNLMWTFALYLSCHF